MEERRKEREKETGMKGNGGKRMSRLDTVCVALWEDF